MFKKITIIIIHLLTCTYLKLPVRSDAPGLSSTCEIKFAPRLKIKLGKIITTTKVSNLVP